MPNHILRITGREQNGNSGAQELQSLRQSRDRYRDLVQASDDAMWLTDPYGYITMVTPRAAEMLGFPTWGQMLRSNITWGQMMTTNPASWPA